MTSRLPLPATLAESPVIAIVRGGDPAHLLPACEALLDAGIVHLEITTNTTGWEDAIRTLSARDGAVIGSGTVLTAEHVERTAAAGGTFVVSPNTSPEVAQAAAAAGLGWYPGAFTPTEILTAWNLGATAVKLFPARAAGGPSYISDVRAPLDDVAIVPTGGIALSDIAAYRAAGVVAVGLGSPLIGDALTGGSLEALAEGDHVRHEWPP
jgi:2-dehydro-3-deoxyphosphogluconate aldolase/(4S)-4-hydroxy-2-oxoglutarate aldolase